MGYMARALVQATMPHSKTESAVFVRENGAFSMALMAHPKVGLPYGSIPRLLVAYLTTEAVRTKSRYIELGGTLSEFMTTLKEVPTGGRWGSITRVREQTRRLFSSSIACTYTADDRAGGMNLAVADTYELWWDPKQPDQGSLFTSSVTLGERFFEEVTQRPVPVDLRALRALKKSPMALDIYCWLTYRLSYLSRPTMLPWAAMQAQFGADYAETRFFKRKFIEQLKAVLVVYPEVNMVILDKGLELRPSKPHVPKLGRGG